MNAKSKTILFILVSFLLGLIAGGFIGMRYFDGSQRIHRPPNQGEVMKEFSQKLELSERQIRIVDSLLELQRTKIGEFRKQYSEMFKSQRDTLRMEIRKHLSEDQNRRYDAYIQEVEEREAKWKNRYKKK